MRLNRYAFVVTPFVAAIGKTGFPGIGIRKRIFEQNAFSNLAK